LPNECGSSVGRIANYWKADVITKEICPYFAGKYEVTVEVRSRVMFIHDFLIYKDFYMPKLANVFMKLIPLTVIWVIAIYTITVEANESVENRNVMVPVIVLDIELLGDTTVQSMQANDETLMAKYSNELRRQLTDEHIFTVLDDHYSLSMIQKQSQHQFLHRCNGCELVLAEKLGAKQVLVPWVFRMSKLIQTMYIEIRDVETGKVLMHIGRNFRGNTDDGWQHVLNRLVETIKENNGKQTSGKYAR